MTRSGFLLLGLLSLAGCAGMQLVTDGRGDCTIVIGDDATPTEQTAARELALHVEQMSGARLPIVNAGDFSGGRAVAVGPSPLAAKLAPGVDFNGLGKEGYLIRTAGESLVIAGGRPRGTLYGVYELLEKHLGCRWYTPDTSFTPRRRTITLDRLDVTGAPTFVHREPWMYVGGPPHSSYWWRDHFDKAYVARTRHSGQALRNQLQIPKSNEYGGLVKIARWGHNFMQLVPPEAHAAAHPDYFALYKGQRTTSGDLGLCLTHPEVGPIAARNMLQWMREDAEADYFFIGQPDSGKRCQCTRCNEAYEKGKRDVYGADDRLHAGGDAAVQGGFAGVLFPFANRIAEAAESEFPDRKIGVFLYESSLMAPRNGVPVHRNLVLWFCAAAWGPASGIRCSCHPTNEGPTNKAFWDFPARLAEWKRIAPQSDLFVYEYYVVPTLGLPHDLSVIPRTVRWYHGQGVKGIFVDAIREIQAGFGFLRYWLWAQMLNDVNFDFEKGYDEFLTDYYGMAAPQVRRFIEISSDAASYHPLSEKIARDYSPPGFALYDELINECRLIWRAPKRETLEELYELFEQAAQEVTDDPASAEHLRAARMCLQDAMLKHLPADDPRLPGEAAALLAMAKHLEMPYLDNMKLEGYRDKVAGRIGRDVPMP